jgi:hypothetical protein
MSLNAVILDAQRTMVDCWDNQTMRNIMYPHWAQLDSQEKALMAELERVQRMKRDIEQRVEMMRKVVNADRP